MPQQTGNSSSSSFSSSFNQGNAAAAPPPTTTAASSSTNGSPAGGGGGGHSLIENITVARGNSAASRQLHQMRSDETPLFDEPFHRDSRAQAAFVRKCAVFAGLLGSCSACSILAWRRYGQGFVVRNNNSNTSTSISINSGSLAAINDLSFFQRYLVTPLLLPAALGVSFVVVRGTRFEREFRQRERAREEWELSNYRQGEIEEMVRIYVARGLAESEAEKLVQVMSSDDGFFVDIMMTDELGFSPVPPPSASEALMAGVIGAASYLAAAILPLVAADIFDESSTLSSSSSSSSSNNNNNNNLKLSYVPEGVLALTSLVYSLFQARMLLRSYTVRSDMIESVVWNCGWVLGTYVLTRWSCRTKWF